MATNVRSQVDQMIRAVVRDDTFPDDAEICCLFLVDRVYDLEEATYLLGLYIGLFKLHPNFDKEQMICAIERGELARYILRLHTGKMQSFYSRWFAANSRRFLAPERLPYDLSLKVPPPPETRYGDEDDY